jgi:hypothetical protein
MVDPTDEIISAPTSQSVMMSLLAVLAVAALHLLAGRMHRRAKLRPAWLTAASGMAVAYVFVHLLPELASSQAEWIEARRDHVLDWLDSQIYLAALVGLIGSVGLDRAVRARLWSPFWLEVIAYAVYNALIGAFAIRIKGVVPLVLAVIAFGAHFVLNDHYLYLRYREPYERKGRWVLAGAVLVGWVIAALWTVPVVIMAGLLGIISGGMIANVLKDELPEGAQGDFAPWAGGALGYAVLLLALKYTTYE